MPTIEPKAVKSKRCSAISTPIKVVDDGTVNEKLVEFTGTKGNDTGWVTSMNTNGKPSNGEGSTAGLPTAMNAGAVVAAKASECVAPRRNGALWVSTVAMVLDTGVTSG